MTATVRSQEHQIKHLLCSLMSCSTAIDDRTACNVFVARGLKICYGIDEFCRAPRSENEEETYLSANEIAARAFNTWHWIGPAAFQKNLDRAQASANNGQAVIAVRAVHGGHGHVCLILPGKLSHSGKWGLDVPNSASFRLDDVWGCYIGGLLSKAFGPDKKATVFLYCR